MMNLHIENALAARRKRTRAASSPEKQNDPLPATHSDYSTWTASYPLMQRGAPGGALPSGNEQGLGQSGIGNPVVPKPLPPAEEDGRVLRSRPLSNRAYDKMASLLSRSSSSNGTGTASPFGDDRSIQSSEEKGEGGKGDREDENDDDNRGKEESPDAYLPSAKRRRIQSGARTQKRVRLPTEKRKAQNRTNQRAFRARKDTYVHDLEVEHSHLLQLVESQKIELKNFHDLVRTLQNAAQQEKLQRRPWSGDSSSTKLSAGSSGSGSDQGQTHMKDDTLQGEQMSSFGIAVPISPWTTPSTQPFTPSFDIDGILRGMVSQSPMPLDTAFGDPCLTEPDLAWAWAK